MHLPNNTKLSFAKTFTELAIQNDLITRCSNASDTANEVTTFFNTIIDTIEGNTDSTDSIDNQ